MSRLFGRVCVVTGAGRGLGRAHALALAAEGASVVVNDLGATLDGVGRDSSAAAAVVDEIRAAGGTAVADGHDISSWEGARALVATAVAEFGDVHVLVNNAGILRDRTLAALTEPEWDDVVRVHLKGSAATTSAVMSWWRAQADAAADRSIVMTTSAAALGGNFGQAAYASAKLGVLALARVASLEGRHLGVRANAISPAGRTRLAGDGPVPPQLEARPDGFDPLDPANVSPVVVWLAAEDCPADGQVLSVVGERVVVGSLPEPRHCLVTDRRWTLDELDRQVRPCLQEPVGAGAWLGLP